MIGILARLTVMAPGFWVVAECNEGVKTFNDQQKGWPSLVRGRNVRCAPSKKSSVTRAYSWGWTIGPPVPTIPPLAFRMVPRKREVLARAFYFSG